MPDSGPAYSIKIAESEEDLRAAQTLRYEVFVRELGGGGVLVDHQAGLERDRFDPFVDHMLLTDEGTGRVVGALRRLGPAKVHHIVAFMARRWSTTRFTVLR